VLKHALLTLARHEQSRDCLLLLESILETPGLMPRLLEVLRPAANEDGDGETEVLKVGKAEKSKAEKGKVLRGKALAGKARNSKARGAPGKRRKVVER
jgi:hypothetical protein